MYTLPDPLVYRDKSRHQESEVVQNGSTNVGSQGPASSSMAYLNSDLLSDDEVENSPPERAKSPKMSKIRAVNKRPSVGPKPRLSSSSSQNEHYPTRSSRQVSPYLRGSGMAGNRLVIALDFGTTYTGKYPCCRRPWLHAPLQ